MAGGTARATSRATVFFDIDGTLGWNDPACPEALPEWERGLSPRPSPAVARAIRSLVSCGNLAFLCTGRSPHDVHPALAELPFSGMVALAGAYVALAGEVVRDRPMPASLVRYADRLLACAGLGMVLEGVGGKAEVRGGTRGPAPGRALGLDEALGELRGDVYKLVVPTPAADLLLADPALGPALAASALELGNSEVGLAENSKREGVLAVLGRLGERAGETFAFGDSENDLPLFSAVDVSVAMGNATGAVKGRADVVCGTVTEDGVATALERLGLA